MCKVALPANSEEFSFYYDLNPDAISKDIFNSDDSKRSDEDQSTIQFGEPMESKTFAKHFVVYFQLFCYFLDQINNKK